MDGVNIPWRGFVLICDGSKALILQNEGDPDLLNLKLVDSFVQVQPPTRQLGTARPGRVHQSHGNARSAMEEADRHTEGEVAFLSQVAHAMGRITRDHSAKSLVVVAPPRALGVMRRELEPAVQAIVTAEVPKDLAHLPTDEIERHLAA